MVIVDSNGIGSVGGVGSLGSLESVEKKCIFSPLLYKTTKERNFVPQNYRNCYILDIYNSNDLIPTIKENLLIFR